MKNKKLMTILLAVLTMVMFTFAGCGGSAENSADNGNAAAANEYGLEDGTYVVTFTTDNNMFHINEAYNDQAIMTVEGGAMTVHVTLQSKKIVNLFYGLAEDAQKDGAELIEPSKDTVTYSDGTSVEVYGFDIPVPALDEEFDVALIGKHGNWYDHKVKVTDPKPLQE